MIQQERKTIAVCGDSWWSADLNYPGQSFAEILCNRNDWNLLSLARFGCSNFAICLQVDKAIELDADLVVIGTTTPDRIEIPIINNNTSGIWQRLRETFGWCNWFTTQPRVFKKTQGISNVLHANSLSSTHPWVKDPTIISESLNNLAFWKNSVMTTEQVDSLKSYMLNLYDTGTKQQYDSWIISDACRRLEKNKIPFLIYINRLYNNDFYKDIEWVSAKHIILPEEFTLEHALPRDDGPGFHYRPDTGSAIFADYIEKRIKQLL